jgi:hypothetical protein
MNHSSLTIIMLLTVKIAAAQTASILIGAQTAAMGNTSCAQGNTWSLFNNPAGLAAQPSSFSFAAERRPALTGADRTAVAWLLSGKAGTLSGGAFKFGDNVYNEQLLGLGYGHKLGLASLGARLDYIQYRAEGFEPAGAVGVSIGTLAEIGKHIALGAYVTNINQPKFPDGRTLPIRMAAGFAWRPTDLSVICGEIEKDLQHDVTIKGGIELAPVRKVKLRTGFNLFPYAVYGGVGLTTWKITIDYAISHSHDLSFGHQVSVVLAANKKRK